MDILVVDDNQANVNLVEAIVTGMGHNAICCASGSASIDIVDQRASLPDLVVLDVNMPGIDGYETAAELKRRVAAVSYTHLTLPTIYSV